MTLRAILFLLLLQVAQGKEEQPASGFFEERTSKALPNVELPPRIAEKASEELSLIADPSRKTEHGIPLYLVNAGKESVRFAAQDRDVYAKLEARQEDGRWRRAQAHIFSWCGNSYYPLSLEPGQHFMFYGYQPKTGTSAEIRYTIYAERNLSTQPFKGLVSNQDLADAEVDALSVRTIPRVVVEGLPTASIDSTEDFERTLGEKRQKDALFASLTLWKQFGEIPRISMLADELIEGLQFAPKDQESQDFVEALRSRLQLPFHPEASPDRLMRFCLDEIEATLDQTNLSQNNPEYWQALLSLCQLELVPQPEQKMIFEKAFSHEIRSLFNDPKAVDEFLPTLQLWERLDTANDSHFRGQIWESLLRRNLKDEVVAALAGKHQRDRGQALAMTLRHSEGSSHQMSAEEKSLWAEEFAVDPIGTGFAIQCRFHQTMDRHPFQFLEQAASDYWHSQIEKSDDLGEDFEIEGLRNHWLSSLKFYQNLETEFDPSFWTKLASYHGYTVSNYSTNGNGSWINVAAHLFSVRTEAARILKQHGHDLDAELPEKIIVSESPGELFGK